MSNIRKRMHLLWERCRQPCIYSLSTLQSRMRLLPINHYARRFDVGKRPIEFELYDRDNVLRRYCFVGMADIEITESYEIRHFGEKAVLMRVHHESIKYFERFRGLFQVPRPIEVIISKGPQSKWSSAFE